MYTRFTTVALAAAFFGVVVGTIVPIAYAQAPVAGDMSLIPQPHEAPFDLTDQQRWRIYLYWKLLAAGKAYEDYSKMNRLAQCESGWQQFEKDGVTVRWGRQHPPDKGVFQINTAAHPDAAVGTWEENIDYAVELYVRKGTRPWVCKP